MKVLVACEFSGTVREAFRKRGHEAWSCDLLDTEIPGSHYKGDIFDLFLEGWDLVIAHPPCTHLAVSGARWFKEKVKEQQEALSFVKKIMDWPTKRLAIENPVSVISTKIRKPDQVIQPWMFGHPETKKTGIWLKGLPQLKETKVVEPDYMRKADGSYYLDKKGKRYSRIHFTSGRKPDRWKIRSKTYQGIADAMADQWGNL